MTIDGINPFCDGIFNVMLFLFTAHPDGLKSEAVSCLSVLSLSSIFVCLRTSAPSAFSPPSDSTATTETIEHPIRRVQNRTLPGRVQAFSMDHQVCGHIPLFFGPSGQARPVVEVAKELVGHFLICRESNVVMRIVETEAYQVLEEIYRYRFPEPPPVLKSPAGSLISYTVHFGQKIMFITAGDDSGDLVLLRTCNAVLGNSVIANRVNLNLPVNQFQLVNMISGPTKVAMALAPELGSYCNLLISSSGLYLLQKDPNPLIMLEGPRILPKDTSYTRYSMMRGADSRFRFAIDCAQHLVLRSRLRRIEDEP